jgi:glycerol uptake facilitator-like aquaporin
MNLMHTAHGEPVVEAVSMSPLAVAALWVFGIALFALVLTAVFLAYLNPALLIEFAGLRLCG